MPVLSRFSSFSGFISNISESYRKQLTTPAASRWLNRRLPINFDPLGDQIRNLFLVYFASLIYLMKIMAAAWKWGLDERKKPEINRSGINSRSAGQTTEITEPNRFGAEILNNADNAGISRDKNSNL